jgi:hypothetical protein
MSNNEMIEFKDELVSLLRSENKDTQKVAHTMLAGSRMAVLYSYTPLKGEDSIIFNYHWIEGMLENSATKIRFDFDILDNDFDKAKKTIRQIKRMAADNLLFANAIGVHLMSPLKEINTFRDWRPGRCGTGFTYLQLTRQFNRDNG